MQDVGAALGIVVFTWLATRFGDGLVFGAGFASALAATVLAFGLRRQKWTRSHAPPARLLQSLGFGGYAIYFPELYPTRLRSTGTGVCYNAARYIAAAGPYAGGLAVAFGSMQSTYLAGLVALTVPSAMRG